MRGSDAQSTVDFPRPSLAGQVDRWLLASAPPERLAFLRIAVSGYVLFYFITTGQEFARVAALSSDSFEPVGIATLLDAPLPAAVVWLVFAAGLLSGFASLAGLRFGVSGPIFAGVCLVWASYHSSWGQMLHFEHLFTLHLLILATTRAADAWSFDARRLSRAPVPSVRYGWPIRLLAITTVCTYAIAGIAKLRYGGIDWMDGSTLANHIGYSATRMDLLGGFRPPIAPFVLRVPFLIAPMAIASVAIELFAPLALLGGRWRRVWVAAAVLFHLGTLTTMMVYFAYQGLGFALLPLYRTERIGQWIIGLSQRRSE